MFPCTGCGACCKHIDSSNQLKDFDLGNGTCKHLNLVDNSCNIYDNRPDICRVDKMFDIEYYKEYTREEFYRKNAEICNYLQEIHSIDKSYRIEIKEIK
jgi:Fe-S-cluster containining protein